jgi:hypothetical protein
MAMRRQAAWSITLCALAVFCGIGCGRPAVVAITPEEIGAHGTARFEGLREEVFQACVDALVLNGYSIEREDAAQGVILTTRMSARTGRVEPGSAMLLRRYEIHLRGAPGHSILVAATPVLFAGRKGVAQARRLGAESVWNLDEERAEWRRLFGAMQKRLGEAGK